MLPTVIKANSLAREKQLGVLKKEIALMKQKHFPLLERKFERFHPSMKRLVFGVLCPIVFSFSLICPLKIMLDKKTLTINSHSFKKYISEKEDSFIFALRR